MKLRTVTIWTTWLLLLVTIVAPVLYYLAYELRGTHFSIGAVFSFCFTYALIWLFSGSPMLVSSIFALFLKHPVSLIVLLVSTIGYGLWFVYGWCQALDRNCCMSGLFLLSIAPGSLPVMIPAWILVAYRHVCCDQKTNDHPDTALRFVPASLEEQE